MDESARVSAGWHSVLLPSMARARDGNQPRFQVGGGSNSNGRHARHGRNRQERAEAFGLLGIWHIFVMTCFSRNVCRRYGFLGCRGRPGRAANGVARNSTEYETAWMKALMPAMDDIWLTSRRMVRATS